MKTKLILFIIAACISLISCKKFLDVRPDKSLAVPATIKDFQALLDNNNNMNGIYPDAANAQSDDYFIKSEDIGNFETASQLAYVWDGKASISRDWNYAYTIVETCNIIIDESRKLSGMVSQTDIDQVNGSALFFRGFTFFQLANIFAMPYQPGINDMTDGIPLKLKSDITDRTIRSNLTETYQRVLSDLKQAAGLLPPISQIKTRPSKAAAYGVLSRVYLVMQDYQNAKVYADSCLSIYAELIDYNDIDISNPVPFDRFNREVIFHSTTNGQTVLLAPDYARVDTALYNSYLPTDLRKPLLYNDAGDGYFSFKGAYSGDPYNSFNGIAVDEILLNRAESNARLGSKEAAALDLNRLLLYRYRQGDYSEIPAADPMLLHKIIDERRKEIAFRGQLRWLDLRRLNFEPQFATIIRRNVGSGQFQLLPNDPRYAMLIPPAVVQLTGIPQNNR